MNSILEALDRPQIDALVQVNTSGEESKSGTNPEQALELAQFIHTECTKLRFAGFMTIGMPDYTSRPEDFTALLNCRQEACKALGLEPDDLEVSMGMSNDFEQAIEMGSTNVRVGSAIFGARTYDKEPATTK